MAWNTVVRFDLAKSRFSLGNASIKYLRWPICEERKKIASFVSSIFLLLAIGLVDSFVLTYNKQCKNGINNALILIRFYIISKGFNFNHLFTMISGYNNLPSLHY